MTEKKAPKARKPDQKPRKIGRPSSYTPEIADSICHMIATTDWSMERICAELKIENPRVVYSWLWSHEDFQQNYARAKKFQAELPMSESMKAIADDGTNDTYIDDEGNVRVDHDHIQRSKLRVETRKWLMGKLAPKKWGDRIDVNHGGQTDNPVQMLYQQITGTPFKPK